VKPSDTIGDVKAKIQDKVGFPYMCLIHTRKGVHGHICKRLEDDDLTLSDCHIKKESTLHVTLSFTSVPPSHHKWEKWNDKKNS